MGLALYAFRMLLNRVTQMLERGQPAAPIQVLMRCSHTAASRLLADAAGLRGDHGGVFLAVRAAGAAVRD